MTHSLDLAKRFSLALAVSGITLGLACAEENQAGPSTVTLENGILSVEVALPGAPRTYRASRFDWSGQVRQVRYGRHTYFGQLVRQNPLANDAIAGIAEEYDINGPASYKSYGQGQPFLKVGVGILEGNSKAYHFSHTYPFAQNPAWEIYQHEARTSITFRHNWKLNEDVSVRYEKTIQLVTNEPAMKITRRLVNLGQQRFETEFYSHQVFCLDNEPIGPGYVIEFGLAPEVEEVSDKSVRWKLDNKTLVLTSRLKKWFLLGLAGSGPPAVNTVRVSNRNTKTAVDVTTDAQVDDLDFFAEPSGLCPELFTRIKVDPGKAKTWTTRYRFEKPAP